MKPALICASVVTQESFGEYQILRMSLGLFYSVKWYIAADLYVHNLLSTENDISSYFVVKQPPGTHGSFDSSKNDLHMSLMMKKFYACHRALLSNKYVLLLDSDIFFLRPFQLSMYTAITQSKVDAILSPHFSNDYELESKVGRYNGGMICVKSLRFLNQWLLLSRRYKENGWYYEQQPIEFVAELFHTSLFPINYNIGWWRMNNKSTYARLETILLSGDQILFMGLPAVCFHVHTLKKLQYANYGLFLLERLIMLLKSSSNPNHLSILNIVSAAITQDWFRL